MIKKYLISLDINSIKTLDTIAKNLHTNRSNVFRLLLSVILNFEADIYSNIPIKYFSKNDCVRILFCIDDEIIKRIDSRRETIGLGSKSRSSFIRAAINWIVDCYDLVLSIQKQHDGYKTVILAREKTTQTETFCSHHKFDDNDLPY